MKSNIIFSYNECTTSDGPPYILASPLFLIETDCAILSKL